jgi:hypothetical protein
MDPNTSDDQRERQATQCIIHQQNASPRFYAEARSDDTVHPLRNEVANHAKSEEASSDAPEPLKVIDVLTGDDTNTT